jgi:hypothetical protein
MHLNLLQIHLYDLKDGNVLSVLDVDYTEIVGKEPIL